MQAASAGAGTGEVVHPSPRAPSPLMCSAFSIIGGLAEIRTLRLKQTILLPFGFLHSWVGRGVFLILIGVVFVIIPWDQTRVYVSKIPAAFLLTAGVLQVGRRGGRHAAGGTMGDRGALAKPCRC